MVPGVTGLEAERTRGWSISFYSVEDSTSLASRLGLLDNFLCFLWILLLGNRCFVNYTLIYVCLISVYLPIPLELPGRAVACGHFSSEWDQQLEAVGMRREGAGSPADAQEHLQTSWEFGPPTAALPQMESFHFNSRPRALLADPVELCNFHETTCFF